MVDYDTINLFINTDKKGQCLMEIFLIVAYIIICCIVLAGFPPFSQWRLFQEDIDVKYFKKIKVHKLSFLFRGIGGKDAIGGSVKKDGVIVPMYIFQILGYCISLISTIVILVLYLTKQINYVFVLIFQTGLIGLEVFLFFILSLICVILTKKRRKKEERFTQHNKNV